MQHGGIANTLMHMGERGGETYQPLGDYTQGGSFTSAFIHEYLSLAKDYIKNTNLPKADKIQIIDNIRVNFDKEYLAGDKWEYEAGAHGKELNLHFNQIKEELEKELE